MHVVIFEGNRWPTFAPLSLSRPVFMLASGASTLLEKQIRHMKPTRVSLWVRPELVEYTRKSIVPRFSIPVTVNEPLNDETATIISGRSLHFRDFIYSKGESVSIDEGDIINSVTCRRPGLSPSDALDRTERWLELFKLPQSPPQSRMVNYLWDLVTWNEESLISDFASMKLEPSAKPAGPYHMIDEDHVWLAKNVKIGPGVVMDASHGPVIVGDGALVGSNAILSGPCYIGPAAQITALANIRPGTTIGTLCKVGGEISNSIFSGFSNKAHDGFLGDSYVGKWVNLGAGTVSSNLKNTYGQITASTGEGPVKTGRKFLGALIGDHVKTAIGTRMMAGTYLGFSSMVAVSGFCPKMVSSYMFLTEKGPETYELEKAIAVMKTMFARRNRPWEGHDDEIVAYVQKTAPTIERA